MWGNSKQKEIRHEIPIIKQFGVWAVHRCLYWHDGKSWEQGAFGPIALDTTPLKHNKACKGVLNNQILHFKTDWAAKAIKRPTPAQKAERAKRYEEIISTFTTGEISYTVSHTTAGLAWPTKYPLDTLKAAKQVAEKLHYFFPPELAEIMVGNRKSLGGSLQHHIREVAQEHLCYRAITRPAEELARCIREGIIALKATK